VQTSDLGTNGFYEAAYHAAPSAILIFDNKGRYLHGNELAAEYMGAPVEEIVRRKVGDFTSERHQPSVDRFWEGLEKHGFVTGMHRIQGLDGIDRAIRYSARAGFMPGRNIVFSQALALGGQRLSPREAEVMQLLARGHNGTRIAEELGISRETVRTHIRNAMEKLHARTRPHGIALAVCRGEIDPCPANG
jgi:PAS domain S-box-containing protein